MWAWGSVSSLSDCFVLWGFPKIRGAILGVPRIRIIVFWGLYLGLPIWGSYHIVHFWVICSFSVEVYNVQVLVLTVVLYVLKSNKESTRVRAPESRLKVLGCRV